MTRSVLWLAAVVAILSGCLANKIETPNQSAGHLLGLGVKMSLSHVPVVGDTVLASCSVVVEKTAFQLHPDGPPDTMSHVRVFWLSDAGVLSPIGQSSFNFVVALGDTIHCSIPVTAVGPTTDPLGTEAVFRATYEEPTFLNSDGTPRITWSRGLILNVGAQSSSVYGETHGP